MLLHQGWALTSGKGQLSIYALPLLSALLHRNDSISTRTFSCTCHQTPVSMSLNTYTNTQLFWLDLQLQWPPSLFVVVVPLCYLSSEIPIAKITKSSSYPVPWIFLLSHFWVPGCISLPRGQSLLSRTGSSLARFDIMLSWFSATWLATDSLRALLGLPLPRGMVQNLQAPILDPALQLHPLLILVIYPISRFQQQIKSTSPKLITLTFVFSLKSTIITPLENSSWFEISSLAALTQSPFFLQPTDPTYFLPSLFLLVKAITLHEVLKSNP